MRYITNESMQTFDLLKVKMNRIGEGLGKFHPDYEAFMKSPKKMKEKQLLMMLLVLMLLHLTRAMRKASRDWIRELEPRDKSC